jgi:hypothetical protein
VARSPTRSCPRIVWPPSRRSAPCWIGPPRPSRTGGCCHGADRFDKQPEVYTKTATTCKLGHPPTLDRLGKLACRNADRFSSATTGNAPRFSRPPPLGAVLIPQPQAPATARTSPTPGGDAPFPPYKDPNRAWYCSVLVVPSGPPSPGKTSPPARPGDHDTCEQLAALPGAAKAPIGSVKRLRRI